MVTRHGWLNCACVPGMLSPLYPAIPVPAIVVRIPFVSIFCTTLFRRSPQYTLPAGSVTIPRGSLSFAFVAGPLLPENPVAPVPAIVVIVNVGTVAADAPPASKQKTLETKGPICRKWLPMETSLKEYEGAHGLSNTGPPGLHRTRD